MPEAKSLVIELPDNPELVEKLRRKLAEYEGRLRDREPYEHPDLYAIRTMSTRCKIAVLERLLRDGKVITWDLCLELARKWNITPPVTDIATAGEFARAFPNACGVIAVYCGASSAPILGGTGLK